ncbi:Suppressor of fused domain protein [Nocardioides sp. Root190]|uniref:suppressor of fused domain protein n=1 Tax=Nocardioides sp. Root190 TaxID=1736488 RepID=UPI0007000B26|nr:suppressor of fused domain protein [Nocardioides sp. Root190]KRB76508.1 Suppressor of fused domain protein [Nocardioides sp. Root190]
MTKEEYLARAAAQDDWAPGWEAIDAAFDRTYPGVTPRHYATDLPSRAMFGGQNHLDGISLFPNPRGHQHVVTYGMSGLYVDEESFGGEFSGWGYEMTIKLRDHGPDDCGWAVSSLSNLARYTYTTKRWFEPLQFVSGSNQPLRVGSDTLLTSYLVVPDTDVAGVETAHGRLDFLQLVGVTQAELDWVAEDAMHATERVQELLGRMAADGNPSYVTDLARTTSYV